MPNSASSSTAATSRDRRFVARSPKTAAAWPFGTPGRAGRAPIDRREAGVVGRQGEGRTRRGVHPLELLVAHVGPLLVGVRLGKQRSANHANKAEHRVGPVLRSLEGLRVGKQGLLGGLGPSRRLERVPLQPHRLLPPSFAQSVAALVMKAATYGRTGVDGNGAGPRPSKLGQELRTAGLQPGLAEPARSHLVGSLRRWSG